MEKENSSCIYY